VRQIGRLVEEGARGGLVWFDIEMTFDDPRMYTRPFAITMAHQLLADNDIFEWFSENEKDRAHLKK
jgi:hypothetical protein